MQRCGARSLDTLTSPSEKNWAATCTLRSRLAAATLAARRSDLVSSAASFAVVYRVNNYEE